MIPLSTTILVLIAAVDHIIMAAIYTGWHNWRANIFTYWLAILVVSFAIILTYVAYNVVAALVHWPLASGTWISDVAYGLVAVVGLMGDYVFIKETRRQRKENPHVRSFDR